MAESAAPRLGSRALFPELEARVYANHASIAPPSTPVRRAIEAVVTSYARKGAGAFFPWIEQRERLRADLAALMGAQPKDLGFVSNTSHGVSTIATCLDWQRGDRVVGFQGEFPANVTPWQQAARTHGLEFVSIPQRLDALEDELKRGVRLVAVSEVQFQTGRRMPTAAMARLCHRYGAELFVDAIQALGVVPMDVAADGIDYLAAGSHKWLMGPEGGGVLYVAPKRIGALVPRTASWLSHEEPLRFLFEGAGHLRTDRPIRVRTDFVEGGVACSLSLAGLGAAVTLLRSFEKNEVFGHVTRWLDALEPGLVERGFVSERTADDAGRSGILALRPPDDVPLPALFRALDSAGIGCASPDGRLRFSPHWPNALSEVPIVLEAVDEALEKLRG